MAENSLKKGQYTRFSNKIGLYSANQENVGFIKKAICIIWLKLVLHLNIHHRHTIQPRLEYKRHIPTYYSLAWLEMQLNPHNLWLILMKMMESLKL